MCLVFPMCISVFPLYSHYRMDELLVSFYATTLPIPLPISILLLIFRSHPLVYSSLSLPFITCRTYNAVRYLYAYIDYLSIYLCIYVHTSSVVPITTSLCHCNQFSFSILLHGVIIRFLSLPIYLFLDVFRCVSHLLTSYINFHILPSCLQNFTKNI